MKKDRIARIFAALSAAALLFILTADSEGTINSVKQSVNVCLTVIIPSLFAFLIFSQLFIKSGIGDVLFYPLYKLNSFWFKGSGREFSIFMISLFGGYPVGIKLLKNHIAYNKNYTAIAETMLCYCYCGSPSFIIQVVGLSVLGNAAAGFYVYLSNIASCLTAAILVNIFSKKKRNNKNNEIKLNKLTVSDFSYAISDTVKSLSIICATIVVFNLGIEIIRFSGILHLLEQLKIDKYFLALSEISNLSVFKGNSFGMLPFFSAATSFGGACIIIQTAALSKSEFSLKKFLVCRLPISLLSALYMYLIMKIFPLTSEVFSYVDLKPSLYSVEPLSTVCLIVMTYILLKEISKTESSI